MARRDGQVERAAIYENAAAASEALFGNSAVAKKGAAAALKLSGGREVEYSTAVNLALAGDTSRLAAATAYLEKVFSEDTSAQFHYLPVLRAFSALDSRDPSRAVDALQPNLQYEKGLSMLSGFAFMSAMYPAHVRGEAYLRMGKFTDAAAEFQKILDNRGILLADPLGAVARVQLGRSLKLLGAVAKAKAAYESFFGLWKDADPDIPLLITARDEYSRL